jgi:magnesium chelatase subunit I
VNALSQKIVDARGAQKNVTLDYDFRVKISQICSELDVDGLRGDIVTERLKR